MRCIQPITFFIVCFIFTTTIYSQDRVKVAAGKSYKAEKKNTASWLGKNYRDVWTTPVDIKVFNPQAAPGPFIIVKQGGGMQTLSLRLQNTEGRQYVLRTIDKHTDELLPDMVSNTWAADILQDQVSASHPYGALVIAPLAEAIGVYHTNPQIVYLADDPWLGEYRDTFKNTMVLFEERPDEDWSDQESFGYSKDIYSTNSILEKTLDKQEDKVEQSAVLRARLLDLLIGDWDRHEDQWRWASFKSDKLTSYKPVPRDRDQAFFVNQGILPNIISRKWLQPKFQGFDKNVRDINGLFFNARHFDRNFLNELSRKDWEREIKAVQAGLTDEVIEQAINRLPEEIFDLPSTTTIIKSLKGRRDQLSETAIDYYTFLSEIVSIPGTNEDEIYNIDVKDNGLISVRVIDEHKKVWYQRAFDPNITDEIRLYGLEGKDTFNISGNGDMKIKLRIIGGAEEDVINGSLKEDKKSNVFVYDLELNTIITGSQSIKKKLGKDSRVNTYDRREFKYDLVAPVLDVAFNVDDGTFIGGGVLIRKQAFRKDPFAISHRVSGNYAFATSAYNLKYQLEASQVIGDIGLKFDFRYNAPTFVQNFFGFGNGTDNNEDELDIDFYRARVQRLQADLLFNKKLGKYSSISGGPSFQSIDVENTNGRILSTLTEMGSIPTNTFDQKLYAGIRLQYVFDSRNNLLLASQGWHSTINYDWYDGTNAASESLSRLDGQVSTYYDFQRKLPFVIAVRVGGSHIFSDFEFFQTRPLGGLTGLRGYRRDRFTGESTLYNNIELRTRLFKTSNYLVPGYFGLILFHDAGRVWTNGQFEDSNKWHTGYGAGIWFSPAGLAVVNLSIGISEEDVLPLFGVGFLF